MGMTQVTRSTMRHMSTLRRLEPQVVECFKKGFLHQPSGPLANLYADTPNLVVLFTWLGAKERYADKYIHSWTRRGFHVLQVSTTVRDLLMPKTGTEVTAQRLVDYLHAKEDFKFLLHGLSVGGYLGLRLLSLSSDSGLVSRVTAQVFDSFTHVAGIEAGVENAVPTKFQKIAAFGAQLYTKYADLSVFNDAADFMRDNKHHTPTLYMHSMADNVAKYDVIKDIIKDRQMHYPISTLLIPKSENIAHVALLRNLGEKPYMASILRFLKKNDFPLRENLAEEVSQDESLLSYEDHPSLSK